MGNVRSHIPYKDRLLLEKYKTIQEHRDDAMKQCKDELYETFGFDLEVKND